jgi:outer membrane protein assembly factor BamB
MLRLGRLVAIGVLPLLPTQAEEWPQFRGPNGTGVAEGSRLPDQIRPGAELWQARIPPGHSSPVVIDGRLFITAFDSDELLTIALDARTGKELWRRQVKAERRERLDKRNSPASPSPAAGSGRIIVFFPDFGLLAYDMNGRELWRTRLGPFDNFYGMGASPILVDGKVVLVCDQSRHSFIAAFHSSTGQLLWRRDRPHAVSGHSTPSVYRSPKATVILAPASFRMDAYDAETGESIWWVEGLPSEMKSVPVVHGAIAFVSGYNLAENDPGRQIRLPAFKETAEKHDKNGDGLLARDESPDELTRKYFPFLDLDHNGVLDEREWTLYAAWFKAENSLQAIRLSGRGDVTATNIVWKYHRSIPQLPSVLVYLGEVYMINDSGILTILDAAAGGVRKQFRLNGESANYFASPVAGDSKVFFASHDGTVTVLRAGGEYDVLSKAAFEDTIYATPALVDGCVYIRTGTRLFCFTSRARLE